MTVVLGIDTGGTYTDAALVNHENGKVLSCAKALTTRDDLSIGIQAAITSVLTVGNKKVSPHKIKLVGLSTTLATNAIAEKHGVPVCLLLIGYDQELINQYRFQHTLGTQNMIYLPGGHDLQGHERESLDEDTVKKAILEWSPKVGAFAVSGYFGAFNPEHELRVKKLIEQLSDLPVTCGHELSTKLNAIRRATTACLNARLIPIIRDLISRVRATLSKLSVSAPLMVVKGDGSLVQDEWAVKRPIETVLSGPAASALGALKLSSQNNTWAVDIGGTTTDIVELNEGLPSLNSEGASIGGWRTMVEAVDVYTIGLGGDSHVRVSSDNELLIGPNRVVPLCKLASEYPDQVLPVLKEQIRSESKSMEAIHFLLPGKTVISKISSRDEALLARLQDGPIRQTSITDRALQTDPWLTKRIQQLIENGYMQMSGFTPTDALHIMNQFNQWQSQASLYAGKYLAALLNIETHVFCQKIIDTVSRRVATAIATKALMDETGYQDGKQSGISGYLLDKALRLETKGKLVPSIQLQSPIVALGAPVEAYIPTAAKTLQTRFFIPEFARVANAIGAVSGEIIQRIRVRIRPSGGNEMVRLHCPQGPFDFEELEEAVDYAKKHIAKQAKEKAQKAGANQIQIHVSRKDKKARVAGNREVFLETELTFMALGRPGLGKL